MDKYILFENIVLEGIFPNLTHWTGLVLLAVPYRGNENGGMDKKNKLVDGTRLRRNLGRFGW